MRINLHQMYFETEKCKEIFKFAKNEKSAKGKRALEKSKK